MINHSQYIVNIQEWFITSHNLYFNFNFSFTMLSFTFSADIRNHFLQKFIFCNVCFSCIYWYSASHKRK